MPIKGERVVMNKKNNHFIKGALFTVILILIDQVTKYLAQIFLAGKNGVMIIPGVLQLFYLENCGAAFGMLENRQIIFILIAVAMICAAVYIYCRIPADAHYHFLRILCVMITAGAAGNMLDRLMHNYVIDFIYFSLIDFPVFNVADCYVCIGAALTVLAVFTVYKDDDFAFLLPAKKKQEDI